MKEFDYIIIGGGCAGLSLAYELEVNNKLKEKTLAIIETRDHYKRDKTWSFWKVFDHNFEDCVIKSWNNFTVNSPKGFHELINKSFPYQSIDSEKFYKKAIDTNENSASDNCMTITTTDAMYENDEATDKYTHKPVVVEGGNSGTAEEMTMYLINGRQAGESTNTYIQCLDASCTDYQNTWN